jgi:hypothetical protein
LPRKTDSTNPADWLWIADSDLEGVRLSVAHEVAYYSAQGKLAEVLEKILKAELIHLGWPLEKTHDLGKLLGEMTARQSPILTVRFRVKASRLPVPARECCSSACLAQSSRDRTFHSANGHYRRARPNQATEYPRRESF